MRSHYRQGGASRSTTVLRSSAMLGASTAIALLAAGCTTAASEATKEDGKAGAGAGGSSTVKAAEAKDLKDGTYSATGHYTSPGGYQSVDVKLSLKGGVVTDVTVTPGAVDAQSQRFQSDFADHVAQKVKGKSLADANVSVVASSSLTSQGFNEALAKIAEEAGD